MTSIVLNVDLTVDIPNSENTAELHSVKNSLGSDITDSFKSYCSQNGYTLNSQNEIEEAAEKYSKENINNSALLP